MHALFLGVVTLAIACLAFHIIPLFRWLCMAAFVVIARLIINASTSYPISGIAIGRAAGRSWQLQGDEGATNSALRTNR